MTKEKHTLISYFIAAVWIANGLLCKVMNLVPRHQEIVAAILNEEYARELTMFIGVLELVMAVWVLSGIWCRINAIAQMIVIATMNIMEYLLVPDLLLWGKLNSLWALLFIFLIYYNEFKLKQTPQSA